MSKHKTVIVHRAVIQVGFGPVEAGEQKLPPDVADSLVRSGIAHDPEPKKAPSEAATKDGE